MQVQVVIESALKVSAAQQAVLIGGEDGTGSVALANHNREAEALIFSSDAVEWPDSGFLCPQLVLEKFSQCELVQLRVEILRQDVLFVNAYLHVARLVRKNRQKGAVNFRDADEPGGSFDESVNVFSF